VPMDEKAAEQLRSSNLVILHGDEEIAIQQALQLLLSSVKSDGMAELNLSRLDGRSVTKNDLHNHLHLLPFGAERRLVILSHALTQLKTKTEQEDFEKLLDSLPPTTQLVMLIPDAEVYERGQKRWQVLSRHKWLSDWMAMNDDKVYIQHLRLPNPREMSDWIQKEVLRLGGEIEPRAAADLAIALGNDTLLASQEIEKLLIYTARERAVTSEDVRELCSPVDREDIFAMVDAIAKGDAKTAIHLLDISLQKQPEPLVFAMIVGHFRQLLIAAEMVSERCSIEEIAREEKKPDFVVRKLVDQVRRFTLPELDEIYQRLVLLDMQIKDSRMPPDLALELFVAEMARK
jgi:DNA polymerase III subunit delta